MTVDHRSAGGTATVQDDSITKYGPRGLQPGPSEKTVQVAVSDDRVEDDNETFTLTLSSASGAGVADGVGDRDDPQHARPGIRRVDP